MLQSLMKSSSTTVNATQNAEWDLNEKGSVCIMAMTVLHAALLQHGNDRGLAQACLMPVNFHEPV